MKAHPIIRNIAVHIYYLVLRSKAIGKSQKRLKESELTAEKWASHNCTKRGGCFGAKCQN
jgi:hypothetical protein